MNWAAAALEMLEGGAAVALVTVAGVSGSAPREAGARMLVTARTCLDTIGGGNLELIATEQARKLLLRDDVDALQQDYPLGPLLAQCCGGKVRLLIERLQPADWLKAAAQAEAAGKGYALEARIAEGRIARRFMPFGEGEGVDLFTAAGLPAGHTAPWSRMIQRIQPIARELYLLGAGHVGRAVAHIARTLPFRFRWIDSRNDASGEGLEIAADPVAVVRGASAGAFYLVITHAHELDYALTRTILARGDAGFCGVIGSATKRARFVSRLGKEGVMTDRLVCPIGSGAIRSKAPAAIAVAVAGELLVRLEALARAETVAT